MLSNLPSSASLNLVSSLSSKPTHFFSNFPLISKSIFALSKNQTFPQNSRPISIYKPPMNWLGKLGFGAARSPEPTMESSSIAQGPDDDIPAPGQQFAEFGAGCFWGVELAYQRVPGVTKTEVGYTQGFLHNPSYNDVCSGTTNHSEVVRVQYDPKECSFETLLDVFWSRHDPTTLNRQQPQGFIDSRHPTHVCKLHKAIYGLRQAPRAWYNELRIFLLDNGFVNSKCDTSLFIQCSGTSILYLLVYVDDIIVTGSSPSAIREFIVHLSNRFSLKDLGDLGYFLGVESTRSPTGIFLSQQKYLSDLLVRTHMHEAKEVSTPMSSTETLQLNDGSPKHDPTEYHQVLGSLQYLSLTRPDVSFAVNKLSQFMHCPTTIHWNAVKRVLRYLKGTLNYGLFLSSRSPLSLHAFADADWAGDVDTRTSTSAYVVFLGSNPISWSSKKQSTVARSSTEAEYRAIASTTAEVNWVTHLLGELGISLVSSPTIYCDNVGATYLCSNPVFHSRMKHIAIDFHFVRDQVARKLVRVSHVHTSDQLADLLTKPLARKPFQLHRSKLSILSGSLRLRGHDKTNSLHATCRVRHVSRPYPCHFEESVLPSAHRIDPRSRGMMWELSTDLEFTSTHPSKRRWHASHWNNRRRN